MFGKFTERAMTVMRLTTAHARARRNEFIGTEHVLIGLLRHREGLA